MLEFMEPDLERGFVARDGNALLRLGGAASRRALVFWVSFS